MNMMIKLRNVLLTAVLFVITLTALSAHAKETSLLQKAQMQRLITALEIKDYKKSLQIIESLQRDGFKIKGELLYFHAVSAFSEGQVGLAMEQSERYLKESGEKAKYYNAALELYATATEEYDNILIEESFNDFSLKNLMHLKLFKRGSSDQDLYKVQMSRLNIWRQAFQNNHNGLISTYSIKKNADGTYNLMRLDWLSCPIGMVYEEIGFDAKCIGKPLSLKHRDIASYAKNFKFLPKGSNEELTGWRLPHEAHIKFDSSPKPLYASERKNIEYIRHIGLNSKNGIGFGHIDGPHRFVWPVTFQKHPAEPVTSGSMQHFRPGERFPCMMLLGSLYCGPDDNNIYGTVLIRGPYTVRSKVSAKCTESDLVVRGSDYQTVSKTLCEIDEKGFSYFLNEAYSDIGPEPTKLSAAEVVPESSEAISSEKEKNVLGDSVAKELDSSSESASTKIDTTNSNVEQMAENESPTEDDSKYRNVVLYREDSIVNSGAYFQIHYQGKSLGTLKNSSMLKTAMPSGEQTIKITYITDKVYIFDQVVTIPENEEAYILFKMNFSFSDNPQSWMTIESVSLDKGRDAVAKLKK